MCVAIGDWAAMFRRPLCSYARISGDHFSCDARVARYTRVIFTHLWHVLVRAYTPSAHDEAMSVAGQARPEIHSVGASSDLQEFQSTDRLRIVRPDTASSGRFPLDNSAFRLTNIGFDWPRILEPLMDDGRWTMDDEGPVLSGRVQLQLTCTSVNGGGRRPPVHAAEHRRPRVAIPRHRRSPRRIQWQHTYTQYLVCLPCRGTG